MTVCGFLSDFPGDAASVQGVLTSMGTKVQLEQCKTEIPYHLSDIIAVV